MPIVVEIATDRVLGQHIRTTEDGVCVYLDRFGSHRIASLLVRVEVLI